MDNRLVLLALIVFAAGTAAWAQDLVGPEFQVNTYTTDNQYQPAVASGANGNFVVAWASSGQDGSGWGVFGRRFNSSGLAQGAEFQVNSFTTSVQWRPAVASDASGNSVVVWASLDASGSGVFGQRFDASGLPQGSEFQVNSYTTNAQSDPAIASDASGNFVVVWASLYQDGSGWGVFGQRFDAAGLPQGGEFVVNSYTTREQEYPAVAMDANGNFVVVWASRYQDGSTDGVFGQRFNTGGLHQGVEFQVNSFTTSVQWRPAVASDASGNFVVVWQSLDQDGSGYGIFGRRFDAAGVPQGEFRVNSYTTSAQRYPAVASDVNGNFVVAWQGSDSSGSSYDVFGQRFTAGGLPLGSEFRAKSYSADWQSGPRVASDASGNFVIVWSSHRQDGSYWGVFGQGFGDLIFKDGFQ